MRSSTQPFVIRPFESDTLDRAGVAAVITPGFPHDRWIIDPLFAQKSLAPLFVAGALAAAERSLEDPERHFALLALDQDQVVGVALGYLEQTLEEYTSLRIGTLWSLAVLPKFRRRGIATALFRATQDWMRSHGCVQLNVSTDGPNPANQLYRQEGCQERHLLRTWSLNLS
jgi:ribosomal protein S18 acetylase RimI-like enzyme